MCENMHLVLHVHLIGGRVYWALLKENSKSESWRLGRGVIEEPMAALYHSPTTHLMEAAYEAYRSVGE